MFTVPFLDWCRWCQLWCPLARSWWRYRSRGLSLLLVLEGLLEWVELLADDWLLPLKTAATKSPASSFPTLFASPSPLRKITQFFQAIHQQTGIATRRHIPSVPFSFTLVSRTVKGFFERKRANANSHCYSHSEHMILGEKTQKMCDICTWGPWLVWQ